jgi:hypothetical protein
MHRGFRTFNSNEGAYRFILRYFDAFKTPSPQLGLDGYQNGVPSLPGLLCTLVLVIMVITFFASQASNFGEGRNVMVADIPNAY